MKVFQHVNIVTCDQDFHVYLDGILAIKESQIVYVGQENQEESAVSLDLDDVKNISFNELHQEISNLAPHIKWLFP